MDHFTNNPFTQERARMADRHRIEYKHHVEHLGKNHPNKETNGKTGERETWYVCKDCSWESPHIYEDYPRLIDIYVEGLLGSPKELKKFIDRII